MRIAVVGSYRTEDRAARRLLPDEAHFREACAVIGKTLAVTGHRLVVPHDGDPEAAETHALAGFELAGCNHFTRCIEGPNDPPLKAHFDAVERSDAVVLLAGHNGTYAAGLAALRHRKLLIPIPVFGGSARDLCAIPEVEQMLTDDLRNLDTSAPNWLTRLAHAVSASLEAFPRVLVIHGRGNDGRALTKLIEEGSQQDGSPLLGVARPVVMDLRGKGALLVPDVFEQLASSVSAAVAIVTADDVGGFARSDSPDRRDYSARELRLQARARENVWVEVGWFWGRLGRHRVLIWLEEDVELPSDLQGVASTRGPLEKAWPSIEAFLVTLRKPPAS